MKRDSKKFRMKRDSKKFREKHRHTVKIRKGDGPLPPEPKKAEEKDQGADSKSVKENSDE